MTYGIAQNSEPKYFEKEVEVTDTAKAMAIAEQRRWRRTFLFIKKALWKRNIRRSN